MRVLRPMSLVLTSLYVLAAWPVHAGSSDEPPSRPSGLFARAYSSTAGGIRWERSTDDRGPVAGYEVSRDGTVLGTFDSLSYIARDLERGRTYIFRVVAIDDAGQRSAANSVQLTPSSGGDTAPAAPANLRADVYSRRSLELFWDRPPPGVEARYEVRRDGELLGIKLGTSYYQTNLEPGRTYRYEVVRVPGGGGRSAVASIEVATPGERIVPTPEAAPANLRADVYSRRSLELFWDRPAPGVEARYEVRRDGELLGVKEGTSYYQTNLEPGRTYRYEVVRAPSDGGTRSGVAVLDVATDGGGDNPPLERPIQPLQLRAEVRSSGSAELSWSHPQWPSVRFEVIRDGAVLGTTDALGYRDDTLASGRRYTYRVAAIGPDGQRSTESEAIIETPWDGPAGVDPGEGGQLPDGTLERLLPDRSTVFGEDIDTFPEPSLIRITWGGSGTLEDEGELVWRYAVIDGELVNESFEAPPSHRRMWTAYSRLVPAEWRATLRRVNFFLEQAPQGVVAQVNQRRVGDRIAVELYIEEILTERFGERDRFEGYYHSLFVHETSHVIEAVDADSVSEPLRWCFDDVGCPAGQSYFERFRAEFWSDETVDRWKEIIEEVRTPDTRWPFRELIYPRYPELFVSRYAATNTAEDLAESFGAFVERSEPLAPDAYAGAAKVRWLWQQPALVLLRDQLRAAR